MRAAIRLSLEKMRRGDAAVWARRGAARQNCRAWLNRVTSQTIDGACGGHGHPGGVPPVKTFR